MDDVEWNQVKATSKSCKGSACEHYENCPFIQNRQELKDAELIITNHALVWADLDDNRVLPRPEDSIYIFDEAHHVPDTFRNTKVSSVDLSSTSHLVTNAIAFIQRDRHKNSERAQALLGRLSDCHSLIKSAITVLLEIYQNNVTNTANNKNNIAVIDDCLGYLYEVGNIDSLLKTIEFVSEDLVPLEGTKQVEEFISKFAELAHSIKELFAASSNPTKTAWLDVAGNRVEVHYGFGNIGEFFQQKFLSRAEKVIFTSATLTALGSFERFHKKLGIRDNIDASLVVKSPFNYKLQGTLSIGELSALPVKESEKEHTIEMAKLFSSQMEKHQACLLLFSSRRHMNEFVESLPNTIEELCLIQYTDSRKNLISRHKARIDDGKSSVLIGVQSLSEGLDLPEKYLTFVGIAKIPFGDANHPLVEAEIKHYENSNAFRTILLPDASARLIQSVGRLIRTEKCSGDVVIYDSRITSKNYGRELLNALPCFCFI